MPTLGLLKSHYAFV